MSETKTLERKTKMKILNTISLSRVIHGDGRSNNYYSTIVEADLIDGEQGEDRLIELYKEARIIIASNEEKHGNGNNSMDNIEVRLTAKLVNNHTINNNLDIACNTLCSCPINMKQYSPETKGADKVSAKWCENPSMAPFVGIFEEAVRSTR
jgi:hypothetical protein